MVRPSPVRLTRPTTATHDGYVFMGWFTTRNADNTLEDEYNFDTTVTGDITIVSEMLV